MISNRHDDTISKMSDSVLPSVQIATVANFSTEIF